MRVVHTTVWMGAAVLLGAVFLGTTGLAAAAGLAGTANRTLADAAREADTTAVRALLQQRADPNVPHPDGTTALHWAVQHDDSAMAQLLLAAGAKVDAVNRYGTPSLHVACANGSARMVEQLLKAGASPRTATPAGETALMACARTGTVPALQVLLDKGADVNAAETWRGQTALMWAAAERHAGAVTLLIGRGADLRARSRILNRPAGAAAGIYGDAKSVGGFTPFLFAVRAGDIETSKVFLDAGVTVTESAADGTGPLMLAILNGHYELAAFLLDRGADANVTDVKHGSTLHALEWVRRPVLRSVGMGSSAIAPRIPTGAIDSLTLARKLIQKGADPNVRMTIEDPKYSRGASGATFYYVANPPDVAVAVSTLNWDGATPFWVAAKNADAPFMRLLAEHGADPRLPNRVKVTPLMAAAGAGFMQGEHPGSEQEALEAAKVAIELGNDVNAVADFGEAEDRADLRFSGLTALHGAAQRGANSIVQLLLDRGARVDVKTREGWTAFNVADGIQIGGTLKNSPDTAALLRTAMTARGVAVEAIKPEDKFAGDVPAQKP